MKTIPLIAMLSLLLSLAVADEVKAVSEFDTTKYLGKWYEIARLPNFFQKQCISDISAVYSQKDDGIAVLNSCTKKGNITDTADGFATIENAVGSQLKVSFLPEYIRWIPFTKGDYWVLKIDPDYQVSLVGDPDREYLWILAREPQIDPAIIEEYINEAKAQGYTGLEQLIYTKQTVKIP